MVEHLSARELIEAYASAHPTIPVRTFFDSGILYFATLDDVLIDHGVDSRIDTICALVNGFDWPDKHPLLELVAAFEGNLQDLFLQVLAISGATAG